MSLAGLAFVLRYASDIPISDDWSEVPELARGTWPRSAWLWGQQAEHISPTRKLVQWAAWNFTGGNLRGTTLCTFLPLAAVALALAFVARQIRGRMDYADAFFPLALLHLGHAKCFLWFTLITVGWPAALLCLMTALFANDRWYRRGASIVGVGLCLLLLSTQSSMGVISTLPLAIGLAVTAMACWRSGKPHGRRNAVLILVFTATAALVVAAYLVGYHPSSLHSAAFSLQSTATTAAEFVTMSIGPLGRRFWPISGFAVGSAVAASLALLIYALFSTRREERLRVFLMLMALAASLGVAVAVGRARQLQGGLLDRYALYSVPILCCVYFIWVAYSPQRLGRFVQMCLFALMCASSLYYVSHGIRLGKDRREKTEAFYEDVAAGIPLTGIVARHSPYFQSNEECFRKGLETLRKARIGRFAQIAPDPPMKEKPLSLKPTASHHMTLKDGVWHGTGRDSQLVFSLNEPTSVYAIRFNYTLHTQRGATEWNVSWVRADTDEPLRMVETEELLVNFNTARQRREETQIIWIDKPICQIAVSPSAEPCKFRLSGITLLVK